MHKLAIKGFTLIELTIYIALVAIVLSVVVSIAFTFVNDQTKLSRSAEIQSTGDYILQKMRYEVQRAADINGQTIFDSPSGKLVLDTTAASTITFDIYSHQVDFGGTLVDVNTLRIQRGASSAIDLTGPRVNVVGFYVTDQSTATTETVDVELTLEAVNPSSAQAYESSKIWDTTFSIRRH